MHLATVCVCVAVLAAASTCDAKRPDRVLLRELDTITLAAGQYTTGRRSSSVQQLKCLGYPPGMDTALLPTSVQCRNRGSDGSDTQWECFADLPANLRFGPISVSCEGYDYPTDDYVLVGSCGLEYHIEAVAQPNQHHANRPYTRRPITDAEIQSIRDGIYSVVTAFFALILVAMLVSAFIDCLGRKSQTNNPAATHHVIRTETVERPQPSRTEAPVYATEAPVYVERPLPPRIVHTGWCDDPYPQSARFPSYDPRFQYYNSGYPPTCSGAPSWSSPTQRPCSDSQPVPATRTASGFGATKRR